ncbi:ABC-2 type transport system ATP-binding protein [Evansella vedderi]|uniref:ABC-2 type transport system ATP-binding protein n=1 Tax=Evansella vedderi TaxID=38282 RepID=A0ABT9ZYT5_9BACI|nr:ABC transporter ATP-binding protein [Evansella vedderi]MDQ0256414.1 ABC-2 type transport system ATP-binding protein [Evansella vedderi]
MVDQIKIKNLSKSYGKTTALRDINIEFNKGKIYAVLGHNGAGKTTLMKEILGLYKKNDAIHYYHDGQVISFPKYQMSFSPEQYSLLEDLTALEYLMFVAKLYKKYHSVTQEKIYELLRIFELYEKRNKFLFTMSNGMKKKISHIAAIVLETDFVFLDEPFAALDPVSIYTLKKMMKENIHNQTYILCTHQLDIVDSLGMKNDRFEVILLKQGNLIFQGNIKQLLYNTNKDSIEEAYLYYH